MKTTEKLVLMTLLALVQAGCGASYNKSPVPNLPQMRANGKAELAQGPQQAQVITQYVVKDVPQPIVKEVPVDKYQKDDKVIVIKPDADMTFVEGKTSSFSIRARVLLDGVKFTLKSSNLPSGATLTASTSEEGLYTLTWTPPYNLILPSEAQKLEKIDLAVAITSTPSDDVKKKLDGLIKDQTATLTVSRDQTPPSDLQVVGLSGKITEGAAPLSFTVTVKVPGTDANTTDKPRLNYSYDGVSTSKGNSYLELDGTRYILPGPQSEPVFLKDGTWQFSLIFDTKNISVQPELDKHKNAIPNAPSTHVRMSFRVTNSFGVSTAEKVVQVKIDHSAALTTPQFDMSSLGNETLEVSPGDNLRLIFNVEAGGVQNVVNVETPHLTGISGNPAISCKASTVGSFRQVCELKWSVPCNINSSELNQKIALTAQTVAGDQKSEPVKQEIVLAPSKSPSTTCKAVAAVK